MPNEASKPQGYFTGWCSCKNCGRAWLALVRSCWELTQNYRRELQKKLVCGVTKNTAFCGIDIFGHFIAHILNKNGRQTSLFATLSLSVCPSRLLCLDHVCPQKYPLTFRTGCGRFGRVLRSETEVEDQGHFCASPKTILSNPVPLYHDPWTPKSKTKKTLILHISDGFILLTLVCPCLLNFNKMVRPMSKFDPKYL